MTNDEQNLVIECAKDYVDFDDHIAVDDGAEVEKVDGGYWVEARVWLSDQDVKEHVPWDKRQTMAHQPEREDGA